MDLHNEFQQWYAEQMNGYGLNSLPFLMIRGYEGSYVNALVQIAYNGFVGGYQLSSNDRDNFTLEA